MRNEEWSTSAASQPARTPRGSIAVDTEARTAAAAGRRRSLRHDEIDRDRDLDTGDGRSGDPDARLDERELEPGVAHRRFKLRRVAEECRIDGEVAVCGVRSDREIAVAGAQVDRLRTRDDHRRCLWR
jgi:hypothetical protein